MNIHPNDLEAIRRVVAEVRAVDADDEQLLDDSLEGETDIDAIVGGLLREREEYIAHAEACKATAHEFTEKAKAWEDRAGRHKTLLGRIRNIVGHNLKHAFGQVIVSVRKSAVEKAPDFNPENLPDDLLKIEIIKRADAAAIKAAMESGRNVPGYRWGDPKEIVQVRK